MRNKSGSAIVDYIIPTAIVGLIFGLSVQSSVQNKSLMIFLGSSANMQLDLINDEGIIGRRNTDENSIYDTPIIYNDSIAGKNVNFHTDGTVSFNINKQNIVLPSNLIDLQFLVTETTGSVGLETMVDEIAYMVELHELDYPEGQVPLEILYGTGIRSNNNSVYEGSANVNATTIKVGNDILIIQKDQQCSGTCNKMGTYRLEGTLDSSNEIKADVISYDIPGGNKQFEGKYSFDNGGFYVNNGEYNSYDWNLSFENPDYQFTISH